MAKKKHSRTQQEPRVGSRFVAPNSVDETIAAAIYASIGKNDRAYAEYVQHLEDATLKSKTEVISVLTSRLVAAIDSAWSNGWQPLDITHVLVRRTSGAHRALLIESISEQYSKFLGMHSDVNDGKKESARIDPRWEGQLEQLGVLETVAEGKIGQRLLFGVSSGGPTGASAGLLETVQFSLDLLAAMMTLPKLERLLSPPGEAPTRPTAATAQPIRRGASNKIDDKILARVRGLLAKAESTTFEEEAESLTSKAQELMARHAIDLAMLDATSIGHGGPVARRIHLEDPYVDPKATLLAIVSNEYRCRSVFSSTLGFSTVFGFEGDLDMVELLFTSLLTQATSSMVAAEKSAEKGPAKSPEKGADASGRSRARSFRQSFLVAFAYRVGERLRDATQAATAQAAAEMGSTAFMPVLVDREQQVSSLVDEIFPNVRTKRTTISSAEGWNAGQAAADRASLRAPGVLPRNR
jgi:hypothetical protein